MASGVQLVHLDGSDIPDAAWQSSLNSIAAGHRVSLITADGTTFDVNASDLIDPQQQRPPPATEVPQQQQKEQRHLDQQQPQYITIIQEDGSQQTINVVQVTESGTATCSVI